MIKGIVWIKEPFKATITFIREDGTEAEHTTHDLLNAFRILAEEVNNNAIHEPKTD